MASLYRRGQVWWSKSYEAGKMVRTSLGTRDKAEARRRLREWEAQVVRGGRPPSSKVTWDTTAADLVAYYRAYGSRNVREAEGRLKQLARYFRGMKLVEIDAAAILGYVAHRRRQGRAAATINVDLGTLRNALRLAQEYGKLATVPRIKMLRPAAPRQGFFARDQFEAVKAALPADLAHVMMIAFLYGWLIPSEVLTLTKAQVDLEAGTLRLEPGSTKNQEGRLVFLTPKLKAGIADHLAGVKALKREMSTIIPWLFPHLHGCHQGDRIKSFRKTWTKACREAGCPGKLRHDLRRTAARNMINLGVPERVTMAVLGHKTTSMLHRYFIVSPSDLQDVARRLSDKGTDNRAHLGDGRIVSS